MWDLMKSGDIERMAIVLIVFGTLAWQVATHEQIDDRIVDIALVILGFYFGTVVQKRINGS